MKTHLGKPLYSATDLLNFMGYSDFLFKVDKPSDLGDYSYEVADTKLAAIRLARPYAGLTLASLTNSPSQPTPRY